MKGIILVLIAIPLISYGQVRQNPVIKSYGGIFDIPNATVKPDPSLEYNVIIEIMTGSPSAGEVNPALDNVARLQNLHAIGGIPVEKMHIVLAVHSESVLELMNNEAYQKKFKKDNPNLELLSQLQQAGVKITACGQSLIKRNIDYKTLAPGIEVATSALTTLTTYQLKGYAVLKF